MNSGALRRREIIYLIPYLLLLLLGAWYRYHISGMIYLEDDTDHYLLPAIKKAVTGEWHKGERPMQYLFFIYYTLSNNLGVASTILLQQILGMLSAGFLTIAWVVFIAQNNNYKWLWHLIGYMMIGVYISSPDIMYYEQLLAPESFCVFVMSALICLLVPAFSRNNQQGVTGFDSVGLSTTIFISIAIFINLYLANPLTKWIFASLFLEVLLLYALIKQSGLSTGRKISAVILPHLLYMLVVWAPESMHKSDQQNEDRVYIEFEQMVYSHFDLLARDKSNFGLTPGLQDSMMAYFKAAARPPYLMKFSNDDLMWGKASALIAQYYNNNYDSIERYYIRLNTTLLTKYPLALSREIGKQVLAFYVPNHTIHKDLFNAVDFAFSYNQNARIMGRLEPAVINCAGLPAKTGYRLIPAYPLTLSQAEEYDTYRLPLLFHRGFWFYRFFSPLFLASMIAFFVIQFYRGRLFGLHTISLLYVLLFIYVLTVAIVHTFDCTRFVFTVYPILLISTCMAIVYAADFVLSKTTNRQNRHTE